MTAPELDLTVGPPPDPAALWARAERRYRDAAWFGRQPHVMGRRYGSRPVLLTAPHAGHQLRNEWPKPADGGTGGLAETLARVAGCAAVTVSGAQGDDPNWDDRIGEFKSEARRRLERHPFALDLHAMRNDRHVDICIGTGSAPDAVTLVFAQRIATVARQRGFTVAINHPFPAARAGTMTSFVQRSGFRGLQIELNARYLDPDGKPEAARQAFAWLLTVIEQAPR